MIHTNTLKSKDLELENLDNLDSSTNLRDLTTLKEMYASIGQAIGQNSEVHINDFTNNAELINLDDISVSNCTAILKNTFDRYAHHPLLEVERSTFCSSNTGSDWMLTKRSPLLFDGVLVTPKNSFVLLFNSEQSSGYKSIPFSSQFAVVNEGSYFVSKRMFMGRELRCELFYIPFVSN